MLVNNVGDVAPEQQSWREITEPLIDRVLAVDVKGTMLVTHEVGGRMLDQGSGAIVNVCSNVVVTAAPGAAVRGLEVRRPRPDEVLRRAFAPAVRVNAFGPGFIETEATLERADWRGGRRDEILARTPLARIPGPEELVGVVPSSRPTTRAHDGQLRGLRRRVLDARGLASCVRCPATGYDSHSKPSGEQGSRRAGNRLLRCASAAGGQPREAAAAPPQGGKMKRWMFFAAPVTVALILGLVVYALPASGSSTSLLWRLEARGADEGAEGPEHEADEAGQTLNGFVNGCLVKAASRRSPSTATRLWAKATSTRRTTA